MEAYEQKLIIHRPRYPSIQPMAIHPAVEPCSPIMSASKLFYCVVGFQLRHRSLVASSFTPSSHLNLGLPTGRLSLSQLSGLSLGNGLEESMYMSSTLQSLEFNAWYNVKNFIFSVKFFKYSTYSSYDFPFNRVQKVFCSFFERFQVSQPYARTVRFKVLNNFILTNLHSIRLFITAIIEQD